MIEAEGLVKTYGRRNATLAVDHVSFSVPAGARFGLLGANGAGKTSTLRILATVLSPTQGAVRIDGHDVTSEFTRVRELVGFLPQNVDLLGWSSGNAYLRFWARAGGLSSRHRRTRIQELVDFLDLARFVEERPAENPLSSQRLLSLAQALLLDPAVVVLDEPMTGLDEASRQSFALILERLTKAGKTIVLSSPLLTDMQAAANQVALMAEGHLTKVYPLEELLVKIGKGKNARVFVECNPLPANAKTALGKLEGVVDVHMTPSATVVYIRPGHVRLADVRETLESHGVQIRGIREAQLKLGDVFKTLHT